MMFTNGVDICLCAVGGFPGILYDENATDEDYLDEDHLNVGYKALNMVVDTYENKNSILKGFPTGNLHPQPFVEGAREKLEKVASKVIIYKKHIHTHSCMHTYVHTYTHLHFHLLNYSLTQSQG